VRADNNARLVAAFKLLYASLSPNSSKRQISWSGPTIIGTIAPDPAGSSPTKAADLTRRAFHFIAVRIARDIRDKAALPKQALALARPAPHFHGSFRRTRR
jgi:hypothetical protein